MTIKKLASSPSLSLRREQESGRAPPRRLAGYGVTRKEDRGARATVRPRRAAAPFRHEAAWKPLWMFRRKTKGER